MRQLLWVFLALDALQVVAAVAALAIGASRARRARTAERPEHRLTHASLARYSLGHAGLLAAGAAVLALPVVLGLTHVIAATAAVVAAIVLELAALPLGRATLSQLDRGHRGRVAGRHA